ncbi:MAG: hypothetical protein HYR84_05700 [Planctomycetes bacterium]|nr:hypothetical protein [Planctomycetota bacterium]
MFRKMIIAVVASLGLMAPLALPEATEAYDRHPVHPHVHYFRVYVRECCQEPWRCYGTYRCSEDAYRAAHHLRHRGFEAFVR